MSSRLDYPQLSLVLVLILVVTFACAFAIGCTDDGTNKPTVDASTTTRDAPNNTIDAPPIDAPPGACAALAGSWIMSGNCGPDLCGISQVGCGITAVSCTSGAMSNTGTVSGNQFSYTGVTGGGLPATCSGTATGNTMSGSCTVVAAVCTFSGTRQ